MLNLVVSLSIFPQRPKPIHLIGPFAMKITESSTRRDVTFVRGRGPPFEPVNLPHSVGRHRSLSPMGQTEALVTTSVSLAELKWLPRPITKPCAIKSSFQKVYSCFPTVIPALLWLLDALPDVLCLEHTSLPQPAALSFDNTEE